MTMLKTSPFVTEKLHGVLKDAPDVLIPFDEHTVVDDDTLSIYVCTWRNKFPQFMDGHDLFGFKKGNTAVSAQTCLEWFLTRLITRYRDGIDLWFEGKNLRAIAAGGLTKSELNTITGYLDKAEQLEQQMREGKKMDVLRMLKDSPVAGTW